MKRPLIIFDIDGTLTDFNKYISDKSIPYFKEHYHLRVKNPKALEISDIFDIKNTLIAKGFTACEAEKKEKAMLNKYWISHRFLYFSLLVRYRQHAAETIKFLLENGFNIQIHSTREKCTEKNIIGLIAKALTIVQCWTNGIPLLPSDFHFYKNDTEKISGIINSNPLIAFDDKPDIINTLNDNKIRTCSVAGTHNTTLEDNSYNVRITTYEKDYILSKFSLLLGKRYYEYYFREANSSNFFRKITWLSLVIKAVFHPIVLNRPTNNNSGYGVIYAANHIRTVDPLVIEGVLKQNIHWVALKRFFDGSDSIFNNSKNPILCKITQYIFRKLDFFPIERKADNEHANNLSAIKDMSMFLRCGYIIGIFPEGTTRKNGDEFFGEFDKGFISLAKRNNASIQPILIYWVNKKHKTPIIKFGKPIIPTEDIDVTFSHYLSEMSSLYNDCKRIANTPLC